MRFELGVDQQFLDRFCDAGASQADCSCGRHHIALAAYDSWDEEYEGEINGIKEEVIADAEKDENTTLHDDESISLISLGNRVFVADCECKGWVPFMEFMVDQRRQIGRFLVDVNKEFIRLQEYTDVMDVLEKEYD